MAMIHRNFAHRDARPPSGLTLLAVATFVLLLCGHTAATAATRWVNDNAGSYSPPGTSCTNAGYSTIQAAVDAASPGDVIRVCPGVYAENVVIRDTSDLTVTSTNGAAATLVKAVPLVKPATNAYVFWIVNAPGVTVRGFTMVPVGFDPSTDRGVEVDIEGLARVRILHNAIFGGSFGVNLSCTSFGSVVAHNTVNGQTGTMPGVGTGINIDTCELEPPLPRPGSHDNSIHHNVACGDHQGGSIVLGSTASDNQIHHNIATEIRVDGMRNNVHHNTTQLVIVDNGSGNILNNNIADPGVCP